MAQLKLIKYINIGNILLMVIALAVPHWSHGSAVNGIPPNVPDETGEEEHGQRKAEREEGERGREMNEKRWKRKKKRKRRRREKEKKKREREKKKKSVCMCV